MTEFTHGVASADPTPTSIVLWTRGVGVPGGSSAAELRCVVEAADGSEQHERAVRTDASGDHTARVVVDGLSPGTAYSYAFVAADGTRSPTGRFSTLHRAPASVRFAVVSCAKYNAGHFTAYRHIAGRDDLAFVVHLGDYIYEAANRPPASQTASVDIGRGFIPDHECRTLDDYRRRYGQYRTDPDLQAAHAAVPFIAVLDDHELADNAWEGGAQEHRPEEDGPWTVRRDAALQAWEEWVPAAVAPLTRGDAIHRAVRLPGLCTLLLMEQRLRRSAPDTPEPHRTQLGADQRAWVEAESNACEAPWLVVGSPSTLAGMWSEDFSPEALHALQKLKIADPKLAEPFFDGWDAYPTEARAVVDALASSAAAALVLSGDVHVALANDLRVDGATIGREWTTASLTSQNLDDKMGWDPRSASREAEAAIREALPTLRWCDLDSHGYLEVEITPDQATARWWLVGHVRDPDAVPVLAHEETVLRSEL